MTNPVYAASQGSLGTISSASTRITVTIAPLVQVSKLQDIHIDVSNRSVDTQYVAGICVRGIGASQFGIIATGSGSEGRFSLNTSTGATLPYDVKFSGGGNTSVLVAGRRSAGFPITSRQSSCGGTDNAQVIIGLAADDLKASEAGNYNGTLTLTISAE